MVRDGSPHGTSVFNLLEDARNYPVSLRFGTQRMSSNEELCENQISLTLTRPIGLPLTRSLRRKLWISADSSLIRQKIGTFFIQNDVIKGSLV